MRLILKSSVVTAIFSLFCVEVLDWRGFFFFASRGSTSLLTICFYFFFLPTQQIQWPYFKEILVADQKKELNNIIELSCRAKMR